SVTALLEKIRDRWDAATRARADFRVGSNGERTVFPLADVASVSFNRQTTTAPTFASSSVPIGVLKTVPASAARIAFGKYTSPDYETPARVIPPVGTATGTPAVQGMNDVYFNLVLPAGPEPPHGWPVAIVGHGGGASTKNDAVPLLAAAALAQRGIAAITFGAVGFGGGPLGTLQVRKTDGNTVTLSAGGRGSDDNGDGIIGNNEGLDVL